MPKRDDDLFQRLRRAGVRKPMAKSLSGLTEDAGKRAAGAGSKAVAELRSLVEEVEKRLPGSRFAAQTQDEPSPAISAAPRRARKASARKRASAPRKAAAGPAPEVSASPESKASPSPTAKASPSPTAKASSSPAAKASPSPAAKASPPAKGSASPAPRGENKAKILAALKTGPHTASEISEATGITTTTVSSALNRLSKTGEVIKADRGYALP